MSSGTTNAAGIRKYLIIGDKKMKPSLRHHGYNYFYLVLTIALVSSVMVSSSAVATDPEGEPNHGNFAPTQTPGQPAATPPAAPAAEKTPLDKAKAALTGENPNPKEALGELKKLGFEDAFKNLFAGDDNGNEKKLREELKNKKLEETQIDQLIEQLRKDKIKELTDAAEKNKSLKSDQQKELYNAMKPAMDQLLNEKGKEALKTDPQKLAQLAKIHQEIQSKKESLTKEDYEKVANAWGRFAGPEGAKWADIATLKPNEGDRFGKALVELAQVKQNQIKKGPAFEGNQAAEQSRKDYFEKLAAVNSQDQDKKAEALDYFKEKYGNDADAMNFFLRESNTDPTTRNSYAEIAMHLAPKDANGASVFSFGDKKVLAAESPRELQLALRDARESRALQGTHKLGERFVASSADAEKVKEDKSHINLTKVLKDERVNALIKANDEHTKAQEEYKTAIDKRVDNKDNYDESTVVTTWENMQKTQRELSSKQLNYLEWKIAEDDRTIARVDAAAQKARKDAAQSGILAEQTRELVTRVSDLQDGQNNFPQNKDQQGTAATIQVTKLNDVVQGDYLTTNGQLPEGVSSCVDGVCRALEKQKEVCNSPNCTDEERKKAIDAATGRIKELDIALVESQTTFKNQEQSAIKTAEVHEGTVTDTRRKQEIRAQRAKELLREVGSK